MKEEGLWRGGGFAEGRRVCEGEVCGGEEGDVTLFRYR